MNRSTFCLFLGASCSSSWLLAFRYPDAGAGVLWVATALTTMAVVGLVMKDTIENWK